MVQIRKCPAVKRRALDNTKCMSRSRVVTTEEPYDIARDVIQAPLQQQTSSIKRQTNKKIGTIFELVKSLDHGKLLIKDEYGRYYIAERQG